MQGRWGDPGERGWCSGCCYAVCGMLTAARLVLWSAGQAASPLSSHPSPAAQLILPLNSCPAHERTL